MDNLKQETKDKINSYIITQNDAAAFIAYMDEVESLKYFLDGTDLGDQNSKNDNFHTLVNELIRIENLSIADNKRIELLLANVKDYCNSLDVLDVNLAFEPTDEFTKELYIWFKELGIDNYLIRLNSANDMELSGGIVIAYKGNYLELSLDKFMEEYVEYNKTKINIILKSVSLS